MAKEQIYLLIGAVFAKPDSHSKVAFVAKWIVLSITLFQVVLVGSVFHRVSLWVIILLVLANSFLPCQDRSFLGLIAIICPSALRPPFATYSSNLRLRVDEDAMDGSDAFSSGSVFDWSAVDINCLASKSSKEEDSLDIISRRRHRQ